MDLLRVVPGLRHHPLLTGARIPIVGVSTILRDETSSYFEIGKPKYWRLREDGRTVMGLAGIGGTLERGESVIACLRREVEEELGAQVRLEHPPQTYLIHEWRITDTVGLLAGKKRLPPLMVILTPPRLGGPDTPDYLAILAFSTRLQGTPTPHDLFGLLRIEDAALASFFARDEVPLDEALERPGLTIVMNGELPPRAVLRPVLTGRAFQSLVRAGYDARGRS